MDTNQPLISESMQMYLVTIVRLRQNDQPVPLSLLADTLNISPVSVNEMCRKLQDQGLVIYRPYKGALLTPEGQQRACYILRRHRLWEVFLVEKLGYAYEEAHEIACQLEHTTPNHLADRLDEFLDFPTVNPIGDSIPRGSEQAQKRPLVPLASLAPGQRGHVARCDLEGAALNFVMDQGIRPGSWLQLMAASGDGVLVQAGEAILSFTKSLADAIWVEAELPAALKEKALPVENDMTIGKEVEVTMTNITEQTSVQHIPLSKLGVGQRGIVVGLESKGPVKRRMMDMGLVPGSEVKVLRVAPLGDPIEFTVKGYSLSLRKSEAKEIQVEVVE
jgi:DtxR family Mn-dependent transcriptional regulator